jgi:hypothetical protein
MPVDGGRKHEHTCWRCRGTGHIARIGDGIRKWAGGYDLVARHMLRTAWSEQVSVRLPEVDKPLDVSPDF